MRALIFLSALIILAACAAVTRQPPDPALSAARETGSGIVVMGLAANRMSGNCKLAFGAAGSGKARRVIDMGWATEGDVRSYRTFAMPAGTWDLYQLECGAEAFDAPVGERGYSREATEFQPLARFAVGPKQVLYLGDVVLIAEGAFDRFTSEMRPEAARAELERQNPAFAEDMVSRPLFMEQERPNAAITTLKVPE